MPGKRADNKDVARLMFASITRPINAALAGAGTLFAVAGMQHPLLGIVGLGMLVGTAGSVGRDLTSTKFVTEVLDTGGEMKALPEIPESLAGQYRLHCLTARQQNDKIIETMETAGPVPFDELRPIRDQVTEMVQSVYRLAERAHHIDQQLTATSRNELTKDAEKIKAELVLTTDTEIRKHLEATRKQKEEALADYDELALRVKRIQAQMKYINGSLESVQFKVMKIVTTDLNPRQVDEVSQSLKTLLADVTSFERSLEEAYTSNALNGPSDSLESFDERMNQRNHLGAGDGINHPSLASGEAPTIRLPQQPVDNAGAPRPAGAPGAPEPETHPRP